MSDAADNGNGYRLCTQEKVALVRSDAHTQRRSSGCSAGIDSAFLRILIPRADAGKDRIPPLFPGISSSTSIPGASLATPAPIFDPSLGGTPEATWQAAIAGFPVWEPPPRPLLIVSPHPDDEILGAGGLIRTWAQHRRRVTILSVTDGEAAYPDWKGLARIRQIELKDALQTLGASQVPVIRLGIADGCVAARARQLKKAIISVATAGSTIIAPYEKDGHPDHEAAGRVCCELARLDGFSVARYPIWMWHHGGPSTFKKLNGRKFMLDEATRRAKTDATQRFSSQLAPAHRAPIVPDHVMVYFSRPYEVFLT
jgi:LmbE family N-acetylglucosaminyl deacetylase